MRKTGLVLVALVAGLLIGAVLIGSIRVGNLFGGGPDPETIASASLQSMQEQARLTPFAARFVAVVSSSQRRFGLKAEKTLILPGTVRYEVDLAKLQQKDVVWDENAKRLTVTLPPLEVSRPDVNLNELKEYSEGGVLMALTNTEGRLDNANRQRAQQELVRQARQPMPMRLARDAAKRAIERSFAMPLRAAKIDAEVTVRFADEPKQDPSYLDRSRRMEDVIREKR